MSLQNTLVTKFKYFEPIEILKKMGYRKITEKTITRLNDTLSDKILGLAKSHFDFKYSNIDFIKALCRVCDVDFNDYSDELFESQANFRELHYGFKPYVFIYTGFKRTSQPIFMLAFLERSRNLSLPIRNKRLSIDAQIEYVSCLIIEHYKKMGGYLNVWGEIKQYVFNFTETDYLVLNPDGSLSDSKDILQNRATIQLGNKNISTILTN